MQQQERYRFGYSFLPGFLYALLLWLISLMAYLTGADLVWLGVLPRNFFGLIGIFTSPLVHSDLLHLLANTFPLLLLSGFIVYMHRPVALRVIVLVYLLSGCVTWFIGRPAYHIGASGVVYGLAGFLLFNGLISRDRAGLAVSLAVLFLYAGMLQGIFPGEERMSWEGHLGGILAGLVAAIAYSNRAAKTVEATTNPHQSSTLGPSTASYSINYSISPASEQVKSICYYTVNKNKLTEGAVSTSLTNTTEEK